MDLRTNMDEDETSGLLLSNGTKRDGSMTPSVGYGAASATVATNSTATESSDGSGGEEHTAVQSSSRADDQANYNRRHTWMLPFLFNIFLACASFSIVMPTLAPYVLDVGAPLSFLPWVVSSYSVGEMVGSVALGAFYEHAVKNCRVAGRGPRLSLAVSISLGIAGSAGYAAAGWVGGGWAARACLVAARFVQGLWTGGQQAIEQGASFV